MSVVLPNESSIVDISNDIEEDVSDVNLFAPLYSNQDKDCILCIAQYLPEYKTQISTFENLLTETISNHGCGMNTCVNIVLAQVKHKNDMIFFHTMSPNVITNHFDPVFGDPLCAYNRLKSYNFFSLFDQETITNQRYIDFVYKTFKHSRSTSLCPYALLAVYVFRIIKRSVGEVKKKHDYLWMYNCLYNHDLRKGKLQ